jgi:hypothetical protein
MDVIRADSGASFLENILHAYGSEMYHFSCGIEWGKNLRYSMVLFECSSFTVSFICPLTFHSLHQESVDTADPINTVVVREILLSVQKVKEEKFCFLSATVV